MAETNGNGLFTKIISGIMVSLMLAGVGIAININAKVDKVVSTQEQLIKISDKQTEILNALATSLTLAMERQVTKDKIREVLKEK